MNPTGDGRSDGAPETILLVDDDENCRIIYSTILRHAGYRVVLAEDGEQGVRLARETRPSLVLMDIAMPKMDGRSAIHLLRGDGPTARTPMIAITARASTHERAELLSAGFDDVILKPVAPGAVVVAVKRALMAGRRGPAE